jgi:hypothetical protein
VPFEYWTAPQHWYRTLNLPEKAVLLIALSCSPEFILPLEKAKAWYGVSPDTAERGLRGLQKKGVLLAESRVKAAPLSPLGYTRQRHYTLAAHFKKRPGRQEAGGPQK